MIGGDNNLLEFYLDMFNCQVGKFPMKNLGVLELLLTFKMWNGIFGMRNWLRNLMFG
jgi:hypothetical protein